MPPTKNPAPDSLMVELLVRRRDELRGWLEGRYGRGWLRKCAKVISEAGLSRGNASSVAVTLGKLFAARKLNSYREFLRFGYHLSLAEAACHSLGWRPRKFVGAHSKIERVSAETIDLQAEAARLFGPISNHK